MDPEDEEVKKGEDVVPSGAPKTGNDGGKSVPGAPVDTNADHDSALSDGDEEPKNIVPPSPEKKEPPKDDEKEEKPNEDGGDGEDGDPQEVGGDGVKSGPEDEKGKPKADDEKGKPKAEDDDEDSDEEDLKHEDEDEDEDEDDVGDSTSGKGKKAVKKSHGDGDSEDDANDADDDGGDLLQVPLSARERVELLKEKLIVEHQQKKQDANDEAFDASVREGQKESAHAARADKAAEFLGYGGMAAGAVSNVIMPGLGYGGLALGKKDFSDKFLEDDKGKTTSSIAGLIGNSIGTVTSGLKVGTSLYRAGRTKSRYARKVANTKAASGVAGVVGGLAGTAGSLMDFVHDPVGTKAYKDGTKAQGAYNIFKGATDAISGGLDFHASRVEKNAHREISGNAANISLGWSNNDPSAPQRDLDRELEEERRKIAEQKSLREGDSDEYNVRELKEARKKRHTLKARKYAMKQAADMHAARASESGKNVGSLVGGIFGGIGSILSGVSKILGGGTAGNILKYIGAAASGIGYLSKTIGKFADKGKANKEKEALKGNRRGVVDEYINDKADRIKLEAAQITLTKQDKLKYHVNAFPQLTDDEAKKIAVLRLFKKGGGQSAEVDDDDDDDDRLGVLTSEDYEKAFEILTEKRAKNILKSSKDDKEEMLDALGLSHDATLEDVKNALSGDIS